jgi:hypothetical protein
MKKFLIVCLFIFGLIKSEAQNWAPAGLPGGFPYHELEFKCIYTDTVNNIMYACGNNNQPGHIFRYNNSVWDTIGTFNNILWGVITYNGMLIVGGGFTSVNGQPDTNIAMFDGVNWLPFGKFNNTILGFRVINNELYAFGVFSKVGSIQVNSIAKWNGTYWTDVYHFPCLSVGGGPAYIEDIVSYHNNLYVGGTFDSLGFNLAVYKDSTWQQVGTGLHGGWNGISKMIVYKDELYIAGLIQKNDGNAGEGIQKWNDMVWSEPGGSLQDINNSYNGFAEVYDMKVHNNELFVCGNFAYAGHVPAYCLAQWDGSKWCGFGTTYADFQHGFNMLGFYNDTLFVGCGYDSLNSVYVDHLLKWVGGDYVDTCGNSAGLQEFNNNNKESLVFPNPFSVSTTLQLSKPLQNATLNIYDVVGNEVIRLRNLNGSEVEITREGLRSGMYFYNISDSKGLLGRGKMIVE